MHRLTARLLLILLLVGVFAPVAMAISAPAPHACCLRKPMHDHGSRAAEIKAPPGCCNHDCCRALVVSQWADVQPAANRYITPQATSFQANLTPIRWINLRRSPHADRAPPRFPIA